VLLASRPEGNHAENSEIKRNRAALRWVQDQRVVNFLVEKKAVKKGRGDYPRGEKKEKSKVKIAEKKNIATNIIKGTTPEGV